MLIVEKMKEGGGNTAVSSGGFMIPKNEADALTYLNATYDFADSEKDPELLKVFCKEIMGVKSFMEGLKPGTKLWVYGHAGFQNLKGWEAIDKWRVRGKKRGGDCLFELYRYAVEENRHIPIMLNTAVKQLIKNGDEVVGVVAVADGKDMEARKRMAVAASVAGYLLIYGHTCAGHSIGQTLGGYFNIPHGTACAYALPWVCEFNAPAVPHFIKRIGEALGVKFSGSETPEEIGKLTREAMVKFRDEDCKLVDIKTFPYDESKFDEIAQVCAEEFFQQFNPRTMTKEDCLAVLKNMYA